LAAPPSCSIVIRHNKQVIITCGTKNEACRDWKKIATPLEDDQQYLNHSTKTS